MYMAPLPSEHRAAWPRGCPGDVKRLGARLPLAGPPAAHSAAVCLHLVHNGLMLIVPVSCTMGAPANTPPLLALSASLSTLPANQLNLLPRLKLFRHDWSKLGPHMSVCIATNPCEPVRAPLAQQQPARPHSLTRPPCAPVPALERTHLAALPSSRLLGASLLCDSNVHRHPW